jgi:hypothetical protein
MSLIPVYQTTGIMNTTIPEKALLADDHVIVRALTPLMPLLLEHYKGIPKDKVVLCYETSNVGSRCIALGFLDKGGSLTIRTWLMLINEMRAYNKCCGTVQCNGFTICHTLETIKERDVVVTALYKCLQQFLSKTLGRAILDYPTRPARMVVQLVYYAGNVTGMRKKTTDQLVEWCSKSPERRAYPLFHDILAKGQVHGSIPWHNENSGNVVTTTVVSIH